MGVMNVCKHRQCNKVLEMHGQYFSVCGPFPLFFKNYNVKVTFLLASPSHHTKQSADSSNVECDPHVSSGDVLKTTRLAALVCVSTVWEVQVKKMRQGTNKQRHLMVSTTKRIHDCYRTAKVSA